MVRLRALISNRPLANIAFAVVVVEAIYYRIERGLQALKGCLDAIAEVWAPVLSLVAPTMTAFVPASATLEQTLARTLTDTAAANAIIASEWKKSAPGIPASASISRATWRTLGPIIRPYPSSESPGPSCHDRPSATRFH